MAAATRSVTIGAQGQAPAGEPDDDGHDQPPAHQQHGQCRAGDGPAPTALLSSPTPGAADVQDLEGQHHQQHVQDPDHQVLDGEHDPFAPEAVPGDRGQGRDQRRRDQLDERHQPGRGRPADLVGEGQDRHPGRPLGDVEAHERQLDPEQPRVAGHSPDDADQAGEGGEHRPHRARSPGGDPAGS
jgi:hypothetical protein